MSKTKNEIIDEMNKPDAPAIKKRQIVSGANYHDFSVEPIFRGIYQKEHHDAEGKLIGYDFISVDGDGVIISNSYSINKALDTEVDGHIVREAGFVLEIEFLGKVEMKNGKPFNRYSVSILE
jgi:hypothetical protein